jgi:hypothetical protein
MSGCKKTSYSFLNFFYYSVFHDSIDSGWNKTKSETKWIQNLNLWAYHGCPSSPPAQFLYLGLLGRSFILFIMSLKCSSLLPELYNMTGLSAAISDDELNRKIHLNFWNVSKWKRIIETTLLIYFNGYFRHWN